MNVEKDPMKVIFVMIHFSCREKCFIKLPNVTSALNAYPTQDRANQLNSVLPSNSAKNRKSSSSKRAKAVVH